MHLCAGSVLLCVLIVSRKTGSIKLKGFCKPVRARTGKRVLFGRCSYMLKASGTLKDFANTKNIMLEVSTGYYIMQGVGSWLQAVGFTQKDGPDWLRFA